MPNESGKQIIERVTMETVRDFLQGSGISVSVDWERPPTDPFPDYRAEADGKRWSFEVTQLWELHPSAYGAQPAARTLDEIKEIMRMIHVPTDANLLRQLLEKAFSDKSQPSRLALLNGDSYCLIIVNGQFDDNDVWSQMNIGQFAHSDFDSVIITHFPVVKPGRELIIPDPKGMPPVCEVWKNGFGVDLPEHTIDDLYPV